MTWPRIATTFCTTGCLVLALAWGPMDEASPPELPRARPLTDRTFEATPERLERGQRLMLAMRCVLCHSPRDTSLPGAPPVAGREYSGDILYQDERGLRLTAPNISADEETGVGAFTDDMLARAIREGVGHDGRALTYMPWTSFRALSDEDLAAVVVALRAVPAVANAVPERVMPREALAEAEQAAMPLEDEVPERDLSDPVALGTYLIELADCMGCHTSWDTPVNPGAFGGGNPIERPRLPGGGTHSTNITPAPSGIPYYSEDVFLQVMREGKVVGRVLDASMPWAIYGRMGDDDLLAIFAALRTLRPVDHIVDNAREPTPCAACRGEHGGGEWNREMVLEGIDLPAEELAELAGAYRFPDGFTVTFQVHEGGLVSEDTGPLYPQEDGEFLSPRFGAPLRFERDDDGRVVRVVSVELSPWVGERLATR